MADNNNSPLLLFYPTSPVHIRDMQLVLDQLPGWRCTAIDYRPLEKVAPGIDISIQHCQKMSGVELERNSALETKLAADTTVLALGAVFEPFALELLAWAKLRQIPVIAIQEVAQLALNQFDINNYDAPFDRLFVASQEEQRQFLTLGYPAEMLCVGGLLANDRVNDIDLGRNKSAFDILGIADGKKPIVYTTSPLRTRLSLHNKDDQGFREKVLAQLADASRRIECRIVVKLHPNENTETNRHVIQNIIPDAIVVGREISMDDLFPITGVLVNRGNSQTCLEAVLRGIPTVVTACGLKTLFHDDGGAYVVEAISALSSTIETALNRGTPDVARVKSKHFHLPPNGVANYIAGEIAKLSQSPRAADECSWNWLIKSFLFVGRHDRALALCEMQPSRSRWQELVRLALQTHFEQRISETISCWLQCTALDPKWYFPHYELAHAYQATGQFDQAIAHARNAIELHPPFHSLWHEIPMRVVMMASLRGKGDLTAASTELKALEERGLIEVVPELLIEAAAQHCSFDSQFDVAKRCLEKAFDQLKLYPVDPAVDNQITERAVRQYLVLAGRHAEANDSAGLLGCLARLVELARSHAPAQHPICQQLGELGEKREMIEDYLLAETCYSSALEVDSTAHWFHYRISLLALKQKHLRQAFRCLFTIAGIPNAPRAIIEKIFSPAGTARLAPYWPASPKSIVKPLTLLLCMSGWFFGRLVKSGLRDLHTSITAVILVWFFVASHFVRRLRFESSKVRQLFYRIRSFLPSPFPSGGDRVIYCPICSARGKFEYQNKLTPLFRCRDCGHVWARNLPDDQTLNALYGDFGYWERDRHHQGITAVQDSEQWRVYLDSRIGILQKLKLLDNPARLTRQIFEIGCAEGMLLHELRKRGMEVMGCEMNRAVAAEGVKALGVDILTSPFEKIELPAKNFDLVMSFHTLEHLRDPAAVLAKVASILRPDGALLLEVPCGEEEYENTDHLHFFSETSLRTLLNKFFVTTEVLNNSYRNSAGLRIGSIYGVGQGLKSR